MCFKIVCYGLILIIIILTITKTVSWMQFYEDMHIIYTRIHLYAHFTHTELEREGEGVTHSHLHTNTQFVSMLTSLDLEIIVHVRIGIPTVYGFISVKRLVGMGQSSMAHIRQ